MSPRGAMGAPGAPGQPPGSCQHAIRLTKTMFIGHAHRKKRTGRLPQQLWRPSGSDIVHFVHLDKLFLEKETLFAPKKRCYKTAEKVASFATFANGIGWKSFFLTRFRKNELQPKPCAKTKVLEASRAPSLGFYNVFWIHYKTLARMRKIHLWAQNWEFKVFSTNAREK